MDENFLDEGIVIHGEDDISKYLRHNLRVF